MEGFNEHYGVDANGDLSLPANSFGALQDRYSPQTQAMVDVVQGIRSTVNTVPFTDGLAGLFLIGETLRGVVVMSVGGESSQISAESFPGQRPSAPVIGGRKNLWEYVDYVRSMSAIAETRTQGLYVFLQPIPGIQKDLTRDELSFRATDSQIAIYNDILAALISDPALEDRIVDVTGVFRDEESAIYSDHIHFLIEADGASRGYELLAESIVNHLATHDQNFSRICS